MFSFVLLDSPVRQAASLCCRPLVLELLGCVAAAAAGRARDCSGWWGGQQWAPPPVLRLREGQRRCCGIQRLRAQRKRTVVGVLRMADDGEHSLPRELSVARRSRLSLAGCAGARARRASAPALGLVLPTTNTDQQRPQTERLKVVRCVATTPPKATHKPVLPQLRGASPGVQGQESGLLA